MSVQTRRLYRVCPVDVKCQSRSRPIPQPLDRDWTWKSRVCPKADQQLNIRRWNSSYSTKFGQSLILDKLWTSVRLKMLAIIIYLSVDKVRTNFGHGQTLDSVWIPNSVQMTCKPWLRRLLLPGHRVDKFRIWTNTGQSMDFFTSTQIQPLSRSSSTKL